MSTNTERTSVTRSAMRDRYILAQALMIAIRVMEAERPYPQTSNIADMKALLKAMHMPGLFERETKAVEAIVPQLEEAFQEDWDRLAAEHRRRQQPNVVPFKPNED